MSHKGIIDFYLMFGVTPLWLVCKAVLVHAIITIALEYLHYPLKRETKVAADDILIFYLYLSKKIRLDFSCESSA